MPREGRGRADDKIVLFLNLKIKLGMGANLY